MLVYREDSHEAVIQHIRPGYLAWETIDVGLAAVS
jgi:hypothetical protein